MPYCLDNRTFLGDLYMDVVLLSPPLVVESVFCRLALSWCPVLLLGFCRAGSRFPPFLPFRVSHPYRFVASNNRNYQVLYLGWSCLCVVVRGGLWSIPPPQLLVPSCIS
jgi:hypothetical protein